jgi:uncharacterized protein with HEPN domain
MAQPLAVIVEDMIDHIEQARSFVEDMTFEQFRDDRKTQRAVERCLEVISEASRHVPDALKSRYPQIPWKDVAGSGNVIRHAYRTVAATIVWDTVKVHLPPLQSVMRAIEAELPQDDGQPP